MAIHPKSGSAETTASAFQSKHSLQFKGPATERSCQVLIVEVNICSAIGIHYS